MYRCPPTCPGGVGDLAWTPTGDPFNFLGFTHICAETMKHRRYVVGRQTERAKMRAKLRHIKIELRRRMHDPVPEVAQWLSSVLRGHYQYYGVPFNARTQGTFRRQVIRLWFRALRRRSHKTRLTWDRMDRLQRWLPPATGERSEPPQPSLARSEPSLADEPARRARSALVIRSSASLPVAR